MRPWAGALLALVLSCAHAPQQRWVHPNSELNLNPVGAVPYSPLQLQDRVVLVNFFATWCAPCLAQLPALQDLHRKFGPRGLTVLAVGMDNERELVLQPFADFNHFEFPVVVADDAIRSGDTPFGRISELPSSFLIARDGHVIGAFAGVALADKLAPAIEKALAER